MHIFLRLYLHSGYGLTKDTLKNPYLLAHKIDTITGNEELTAVNRNIMTFVPMLYYLSTLTAIKVLKIGKPV